MTGLGLAARVWEALASEGVSVASSPNLVHGLFPASGDGCDLGCRRRRWPGESVRWPPGDDPTWSPGGDPDEANVLEQMWVAISSLPDHAVVLAEDETHLSLLSWLRSTWVPTGKRMRIMTPDSNVRRTIFGAIDLRTGRWLHLVSPRATAATFIEFLELILAAYPSAPSLAILLDNASVHRSKAATSWLERHPRMRLIHGPRYCPHHNPVERIWGALKSHLAEAPVGTMPGRVRQVHAFFRQRDDDQLLRCASPSSSPWIPEAYGQNLWKAA